MDKPIIIYFINKLESYRDGGSILISFRMKSPGGLPEDRMVCIDRRFGGSDTRGRMFWGYPNEGELVNDPMFEKMLLNKVSETVQQQSMLKDAMLRDYKEPKID